ncbi:MAG: choice-of-anchor L domain-containing protein [Labilithrix sp.]|nr:choice-of-anchor L domain-containing protein [Labilithrix sp.]MCW5818010.1 choice-of-anchor L domain-containing protein [Labilithrix sp.]
MKTLAPFVLASLVAACASSTAATETAQDAVEPATGGFTAGATGAGSASSGDCVKDPSFYDVPGDGCDNDDDGTVDNARSCDDVGGDGATDFAHAIGICHDAEKDGFGLVGAEFLRGFDDASAPEPAQHGVLSKFGDELRPREGSLLGVLSTGFAQEFNGKSGRAFADGQKWWGWKTSRTALPPGYPKATENCKQHGNVADVIVLKLTLKAPKNAAGLKFDFDFHSSEWPAFVCSQFNDGFIAFLTSKATNDNISFDAKNNPVSVNNAFFDRCTPGAKTGCAGNEKASALCPAGPDELAGTGFGLVGFGCDAKKATKGGATGWLTSAAPIEAGETFTLQLAIWDTGDANLDSSVLVDNFQWVGAAVPEPTTERVR